MHIHCTFEVVSWMRSASTRSRKSDNLQNIKPCQNGLGLAWHHGLTNNLIFFLPTPSSRQHKRESWICLQSLQSLHTRYPGQQASSLETSSKAGRVDWYVYHSPCVFYILAGVWHGFKTVIQLLKCKIQVVLSSIHSCVRNNHMVGPLKAQTFNRKGEGIFRSGGPTSFSCYNSAVPCDSFVKHWIATPLRINRWPYKLITSLPRGPFKIQTANSTHLYSVFIVALPQPTQERSHNPRWREIRLEEQREEVLIHLSLSSTLYLYLLSNVHGLLIKVMDEIMQLSFEQERGLMHHNFEDGEAYKVFVTNQRYLVLLELNKVECRFDRRGR